MIPTNGWVDVAAIVTIVLGVGRLTRVITYDDYPPTIWLRSWWINRVTKGNGWGKLATCFWCFSPWATLVAMVWGLVSFGRPWEVAWWIFWGWLALSYLVPMVIARDEPPETGAPPHN